jgi:hypothetical protein
MQFENTGDPTTTPFVYYISGIPVYPPNTILECAATALAEGEEIPILQSLKNGAKEGNIGGTWTVLPEGWWYHFLLTFLTYFGNNFSEPAEMERSAVEALKLMTKFPPASAWQDLVAYIINDINNLSGWTKSWIKQSAEERGVFKGKDGNYYYHDLDGTLIQIIGARTTPETQLDFITDQVLRNYGCLRQIFNAFSAFAIGYEFARDSSVFPRSMKAALVEPKFRATSHQWQLMHYQRTRSVRWRPLSNFCDPEWLAADLLARITDTLDRNLWQERVEKQPDHPNRLDDDCPWQMDYVLDSALAIGAEEQIYFQFESRTFRWINGTPETKAIISVGTKDLQDHRAEDESLNRLLSVLVWEHRQSVVKEGGVGGARRAIPLIWGPRMTFGVQVDPQYLFRQAGTYSQERWLALALFKEGVNSRSVFYRFLNFWKILELAIKDKKTRWAWINAKTPSLG